MLFNILYAVALLILSPVIAYRRGKHGRYRRGVREKFFGLSSDRAASLRGDFAHTIWLHAVSVGEVQLLPELVRLIERTFPDCAVVVSSSTDTGYDLALKHFGKERVFFGPLDFTWAVRRTIQNLRCKSLILMELELWPNLIHAADQHGASVIVANGRLSERSGASYQRFRWLLGPTFATLSRVGCQSEVAARRFIDCGVARDRVAVTGSLKFDNAPKSRDTAEVAERLDWSAAAAWQRIWCVGSTQAGEEAMALRAYKDLRIEHPELRLILVPRHAERFEEVAQLIRRVGYQAIRRIDPSHARRIDWTGDEVILVDTIGELRAWWGVSTIATVGGSFGDRGGQNMLEPSGYGSAVSFGPNTKNFAEIADELIECGGAVRVAGESELAAFVHRCLIDPPAADALGRAARRVIDRHRGSHLKTLAMIQSVIAVPAKSRAKAA